MNKLTLQESEKLRSFYKELQYIFSFPTLTKDVNFRRNISVISIMIWYLTGKRQLPTLL